MGPPQTAPQSSVRLFLEPAGSLLTTCVSGTAHSLLQRQLPQALPHHAEVLRVDHPQARETKAFEGKLPYPALAWSGTLSSVSVLIVSQFGLSS